VIRARRSLVIIDGRATVERHGEVIGEMSAGDFLGEISLIDGGPGSAMVTAVEPIHALVIACDGFRRLMDSYPPVRMDILTALTLRLRRDAPSVSD
jgi:CRP-like cAMP-binding protein